MRFRLASFYSAFVLCTTLFLYLFAFVPQIFLPRSGKSDSSSSETIELVPTQTTAYFTAPNYWKQFILNAKLLLAPNVSECEFYDDKLKLVIIVSSACLNYQKRAVIRNTIGQWAKELNQRLFFIIGQPDDVAEKRIRQMQLHGEQPDIEEESAKYGDIIQYDFVDNYFNLTYKSILMLRFFNEKVLGLSTDQIHLFNGSYSSERQAAMKRDIFLLKADDDTFLHVQNLLSLVERLINNFHRLQNEHPEFDLSTYKVLLGSLFRRARPERRPSETFFVPPSAYRHNVFPNYLSGMAYLMSAVVARSLLVTVLYTDNCKYFPFEDIYITGFCAPLAVNLQTDFSYSNNHNQGIRPMPKLGFRYYHTDPKKDLCAFLRRDMYASHRTTSLEFKILWTALKNETAALECKTSAKKVTKRPNV